MKFDKKAYMKQYRIDNKDRIKQYIFDNSERKKNYDRIYRNAYCEKIAEYKKQYHIDNREIILEKLKHYYYNNKKQCANFMKQWRKNNINYVKEYNKQWGIDNREKTREYSNQWQKNKRRTDPKFNLNCRMTNAIKFSLKGNKAGRHWEDLVDYDLKDLMKHLNETMPKGYNWEDYINGKLHIDHIIPKSAFNFNKPEHIDFERCWTLGNLRLLSAKENLSKNNKLDKPFQPALAI